MRSHARGGLRARFGRVGRALRRSPITSGRSASAAASTGSAVGSVTIYPNGPLVVRGDVDIREVTGDVVSSCRTVALCRCGRSRVKPYCDGSHRISGRRASTWTGESPPV